MILGIDLHNIRDGGGPNYVRNLLLNADPAEDGIVQVHLFGPKAVLAPLPERPWIVRHTHPLLEGGLLSRLRYVAGELPKALRAAGCDILYSPGGVAFGNFRPYVTISRNMMPFRPEFWAEYPLLSPERLRLSILRRLNAAAFARADGMIYLSKTARDTIGPLLASRRAAETVIAHGVDHSRFTAAPHDSLDPGGRIRIVYPSRLEPYKHQVEVIAALNALRARFPGLELEMCGPMNAGYKAAVDQALARSAQVTTHWARYLGEIPNADLPALYANSDLLVFASACENLPNIVIEAMASGIPICSSSRSPMPEILRDACLYFDPKYPQSIAAAVAEAIENYATALTRARRGLELAEGFSWRETARATFGFIGEISKQRSTKGSI